MIQADCAAVTANLPLLWPGIANQNSLPTKSGSQRMLALWRTLNYLEYSQTVQSTMSPIFLMLPLFGVNIIYFVAQYYLHWDKKRTGKKPSWTVFNLRTCLNNSIKEVFKFKTKVLLILKLLFYVFWEESKSANRKHFKLILRVWDCIYLGSHLRSRNRLWDTFFFWV